MSKTILIQPRALFRVQWHLHCWTILGCLKNRVAIEWIVWLVYLSLVASSKSKLSHYRMVVVVLASKDETSWSSHLNRPNKRGSVATTTSMALSSRCFEVFHIGRHLVQNKPGIGWIVCGKNRVPWSRPDWHTVLSSSSSTTSGLFTNLFFLYYPCSSRISSVQLLVLLVVVCAVSSTYRHFRWRIKKEH